jgi:hypothetical protein
MRCLGVQYGHRDIEQSFRFELRCLDVDRQ